MDGVLADFFGTALKELNKKYPERAILEEEYRKKPTFDMAKRFNISDDLFWQSLNYVGFWRNLPYFPWMFDLVDTLKEIAPVTIASSPTSSNLNCITEKLFWLKKHLGITSSECMFGSRKYLMARPDTLLIDDYSHNTEKFIKSGGKAILVPSSWNTDMKEINVPNFVLTEIQKIV